MILHAFLLFSKHWTKYGPNVGPRPHPIFFYLLVANEGNSINIKNINCNPVVLKKFAKSCKNYYFSAQLVPK